MIARTWSADAADGGDVAAPRMDEFARALTGQLPALRRYAAVLVGNRTAADDLVQDCIERALRQAARLDQPERIGAWLRAILHNLYIDEVRRRGRQGLTVNLTDLENAVHSPAADPGAAMDMDRALARLSFEHRQILLLVGLEGLNYREVADELAVPLGTVMSRLARAREKLRETMEQKSS